MSPRNRTTENSVSTMPAQGDGREHCAENIHNRKIRTRLDLRDADGGVDDLAHECASEGVHGVLGRTVDATTSIRLAA